MNLLFAALWAAIGIAALYAIGRRYFHEPRRAAVMAVTVVLAFALGAVWPYSNRFSIGRTSHDASSGDRIATPMTGSAIRSGALAKCASMPSVDDGGNGSFDIVSTDKSGKPALSKGSPLSSVDALYVLGWAVNKDASSFARGICLLVDGKIDTRAKLVYGTPRADVAAALNNPALADSGFSLFLKSGTLARGSHLLAVASINADGSYTRVPGTLTVIVR